MSLFIETIRIIDGKAFNIDLHNQRLNSTRLHFFGKIDEINIDNITKILGMNITFVTSAKTDEEGYALLREFGLPFKNAKKD